MPIKRLKPFVKKLSGKEKFQRLLGGTKYAASGLRSGLVALESGESIGIHSTENRQEIIIIFEGRARVHHDKKNRFDVKAGSFIYLPPSTVHNLENIGPKLLKYVYITSG